MSKAAPKVLEFIRIRDLPDVAFQFLLPPAWTLSRVPRNDVTAGRNYTIEEWEAKVAALNPVGCSWGSAIIREDRRRMAARRDAWDEEIKLQFQKRGIEQPTVEQIRASQELLNQQAFDAEVRKGAVGYWPVQAPPGSRHPSTSATALSDAVYRQMSPALVDQGQVERALKRLKSTEACRRYLLRLQTRVAKAAVAAEPTPEQIARLNELGSEEAQFKATNPTSAALKRFRRDYLLAEVNKLGFPIKICPECEQPFSGKDPRRKFHSEQCGRRPGGRVSSRKRRTLAKKAQSDARKHMESCLICRKGNHVCEVGKRLWSIAAELHASAEGTPKNSTDGYGDLDG